MIFLCKNIEKKKIVNSFFNDVNYVKAGYIFYNIKGGHLCVSKTFLKYPVYNSFLKSMVFQTLKHTLPSLMAVTTRKSSSSG